MKEKKHTPEQVMEIRRLYATGEWTYKRLAEKYGCCISNIAGICTGLSYISVTGGEPVEINGKRKLFQCGHPGVEHPSHKLTEDQVLEIRKLYFTEGNLSLKKIAERYGVHESTVSAIINNRIWKNLKSAEELKKDAKQHPIDKGKKGEDNG